MKGNSTVTDIRYETWFHRKTLSKYLPLMIEQGLIEQQTKDWRRGKSMSFDVTVKGINWLVNNPLNETLQFIADLAVQLGNPKFREQFLKAKNDHFLNNSKIMMNYFVEQMLSGDKSFDPPDFDQVDFDQPFREALKKILMLHLYLTVDQYQTPEEIEFSLEKDYVLFWPGMRLAFSLHKGALPKFEEAIYEADQIFREQPPKSEINQKAKETHLLGLDFADEALFEEYLKAPTMPERRKIMKKIENQAGFSVGQYSERLFKGSQAELDMYMDKVKRPFLCKFISLFLNQKRVSKYPKGN